MIIYWNAVASLFSHSFAAIYLFVCRFLFSVSTQLHCVAWSLIAVYVYLFCVPGFAISVQIHLRIDCGSVELTRALRIDVFNKIGSHSHLSAYTPLIETDWCNATSIHSLIHTSAQNVIRIPTNKIHNLDCDEQIARNNWTRFGIRILFISLHMISSIFSSSPSLSPCFFSFSFHFRWLR